MNDTSPPKPAAPAGGHLNPREAAEYLSLSRRRLDRYREEGNGPRFRKFGGRVAYAIADLDAWSAAHSHQSTHEPNYPGRKRRRGAP